MNRNTTNGVRRMIEAAYLRACIAHSQLRGAVLEWNTLKETETPAAYRAAERVIFWTEIGRRL